MEKLVGVTFAVLLSCCACSTVPGREPGTQPAPTAPVAPAVPAAPAPRVLAADTAMTTVLGNSFVAPAGWRVSVRGPATILEAPEGDSYLALIDVRAADAADAVRQAWAAYDPAAKRPLRVVTDGADADGWTDVQTWSYQTSPNERRDVAALVRRAGDVWTVTIYDMSQPVAEKRASQVRLVFGELLPKGRPRETFAGKKAHPLDTERLGRLAAFVETGRRQLRIPGVAVGIIQGGKVVFAEGFGERELGSGQKPDADTMFMIASNTKAMTTLMLAKLVEQGKLGWEQPVTSVLPTFRLGDPATTKQVLVKHLICACTGLPRQDMEWLFQFSGMTPQSAMATLATVQPTSKFGELYQYSNLLAGAAGFVGGHVVDPQAEPGAAYDRAMQQLVFDPLGMTATTFDYARAQGSNHARAYAPDIDGRPAPAVMEVNYSVIPLRPAGGAWSSVRDVLKYVAMELAEGVSPDGSRYISRDALLARRAPQVPVGKTANYGMGLMVDTTWGTPVVHHGGDMIGYHSDMMWLPEHGVGAVVLTNGDPGWVLRTVFQRKLLEVLFDGRSEADARVEAAAKTFFDDLAAERRLLSVPAEPAMSGQLAARYTNAALGEIVPLRDGGRTIFDFGEWKSEVGSRRNPDGTVSFLTISPGLTGFEFVVGGSGNARTLTVRDAQHEYVFAETR